MTWVPISESGLAYEFISSGAAFLDEVESAVMCYPAEPANCEWELEFVGVPSQRIRVQVLDYFSDPSPLAHGGYFEYRDEDFVFQYIYNEQSEGPYYSFTPSDIDITLYPTGGGPFISFRSPRYEAEERTLYYMLVSVWVDDPEPPSGRKFHVYEAERGWTFDGSYIPHYLELNWLFQEDPFTYHEYQKVRIHGLTKGDVNLQVAMSGMQGDVSTDYLEDYTEPQFIDLPFTPIHVQEEYLPTTNYTDVVTRGMGIQMKFEGRNTDVNLPEPAHVIQVLALQGSPQGNGKRAN